MFRSITLITLVFYIQNCIAIAVETRFPTNRNGNQFTNMVVQDGRIYLAENGWIHILNSSLSLKQSFRTCVSDDCENINKVLALYNNMIVICGTGNNGICQVWKNDVLYSSSSTDLSVENYLVASADINRPAVGLVHNGDLYLGVTYGDGLGTTSNGFEAYRYLLSRTDLRRHFSLVSYVTLKNNKNEDYLVYIRKIFKAGSFVYFLTNQKSIHESSMYGAHKYISKLVRICINESYDNKKIQSYTDIVLSCEFESVDYNLLQDAEFLPTTGNLVAAFSRGDDPENPTTANAVCVYTIDAVDDAILRAKEDFVTCSTTNSTKDTLAYLERDFHVCLSKRDYKALEEYFVCPTYFPRVATKVIGNIVLQPNSTQKFADSSSKITKVRGIDRYGVYPDVYLGTDKGSISKMSIDVDLHIFWYENNVTVDKGHAIKDMHVGENSTYILTDRKVFKLMENDCSQYTTCNETMESKNPSCGWCILTEAQRSLTAQAIGYPLSPSVLQWILDRDISQLAQMVTRRKELLTVTLVIIDGYIRTFIAEATFMVYLCNSFKACGTCLASPEINCNWCIESLTCNETCDGSFVRQGEKDGCPRLLKQTDIYLPNGISKNVSLLVANLVPHISYLCAVNESSGVVKTDAVADIARGILYCDIQVSAEDSHIKTEVSLVVYQVKDEIETQILSHQEHFVIVYKCERLATDCTTCNALKRDRYDCHWCVEGHCGHKSTCVANDTCPLPTVTKVKPNEGGYKGRTTITVTGTNFGTNPTTRTHVTVGYVMCRNVILIPLDDDDFEFIISEIRCSLPYIGDLLLVGKTVNLTLKFDSFKVEAGQFMFKKPVVTSIEPDFGPASGGTRITLHGTDLMIGNRINYVQLGHFPLCYSVENADANSITCTTPNIGKPVNVTKVRIVVDGRLYDSNASFKFLPAPMIETISSYRFIISGGTNLTIYGQNLENAWKTNITTFYAGESTTGKCESISSHEIVCSCPPAPSNLQVELRENIHAAEGDQIAERGYISAELAIYLDGYVKRFNIKYFRDPVLNGFHEKDSVGRKTVRQPLYITGQYMNLAADVHDYKVSVGRSGICYNSALTENSLSCTLQHSTLSQKDDGMLPVMVSVGFFTQSVGYFKYTRKETNKSTTNENILKIGVSVSAVLVVLIIAGTVVFCVMYRRAKQRVPKIKRSKKKSTIMDHITGLAARFKNNNSPSTTTDIELNQQTGGGVYEGLDLNQPDGSRLYSDLAQR